MFTGIVDHIGELTSKVTGEDNVQFTIKTQFKNLSLGESISVNGVCLTVTAFDNESFDCDVSPETLHVTALGNCHVGGKINLERALRLGDSVGGHWVTGHIDEVGSIVKVAEHDDFVEMTIAEYSKEGASYLVPKGSVAIDGVSLTINSVNDESFTVMLIPHTLSRTRLSNFNKGTKINIEFDYFAKLIAKQVARQLKERPNV